MNPQEINDTIKGLRENQKTALKLLDENVELKKKVKELEQELKRWEVSNNENLEETK